MVSWRVERVCNETRKVEASGSVFCVGALEELWESSTAWVGGTETRKESRRYEIGTPWLAADMIPPFRCLSAPSPTRRWMYALWPLTFPVLLAVKLWGKVIIFDKHTLGSLKIETWSTPAWAIEFFFKSQWARINSYIENAILDANQAGVRVFGLGALNKNEALNGGGAQFLAKHPDLKLRLVHGNTLTAAAVLQKIPSDVKEVFVLGATSKLGRAISLYLAARNVRCVMVTQSKERYESIVQDCEEKYRHLLVHTFNIEDGKNIDQWVVGRFLSKKEQLLAPEKSVFHQFVVPPLPEYRADCHYTSLPAFVLPASAQGFKACEMTMERRCVHACHAGALVHALQKWDFHEVGAINWRRIDETWAAACAHGFQLVPDPERKLKAA